MCYALKNKKITTSGLSSGTFKITQFAHLLEFLLALQLLKF